MGWILPAVMPECERSGMCEGWSERVSVRSARADREMCFEDGGGGRQRTAGRGGDESGRVEVEVKD